MVAASTVVDVASIDIDDMAEWEPFRMFVLMKEVRAQHTHIHRTLSAKAVELEMASSYDTHSTHDPHDMTCEEPYFRIVAKFGARRR